MDFSIVGRGTFSSLGDTLLSFKEYIKNSITSNCSPGAKIENDLQWAARKTDISGIMGNSKYNRISTIAKYAIQASYEALQEDGFTNWGDRSQIGIFMGSSEGPVFLTQKFWTSLRNFGFKKANPILFPETSVNVPVSYLNIAHAISGPTITNISGLTSAYEILDIAVNYLLSDMIQYAVVINAEEPCDFMTWRRRNQIKSFENKNKPLLVSETDNDLIRVGANCLILKKSTDREVKGTLKAISVISLETHHQSLESAVLDVLKKAGLERKDIDIIICQNSGPNALFELEKSILGNIFTGSIPIITCGSLFGYELRSCTLMNVIMATICKENPGMLHRLIAKETGSEIECINNTARKKILFVSLSQTAQCGALVLEI